jgi:hypothetical protein
MWVFSLWLAAVAVASADSLCPSAKDQQQAEASFARAEQNERAGNARAAITAASKIDPDCLNGNGDQRLRALRHRLGKQFGDEEEKNGRLKEAFTWFNDTGNTADADRVMMKRVQARPDDRSIFGSAFDYFKRRAAAASVKALRDLATQHAAQALAAEERRFAATRDSLDELSKAKDWLTYLEAPDNRKAAERAEKRGDTLAAETTRHLLRQAIAYYQFADRAQKINTVRAKAKTLGDEQARKGEGEVAADYYEIAGLEAEAQNLRKRTQARERQDEGKRQQQFKKDQDKLEKELGL